MDDSLASFVDPQIFYPAMKEVVGCKRALEIIRTMLSSLVNDDRDLTAVGRKEQGLKLLMLWGQR